MLMCNIYYTSSPVLSILFMFGILYTKYPRSLFTSSEHFNAIISIDVGLIILTIIPILMSLQIVAKDFWIFSRTMCK